MPLGILVSWWPWSKKGGGGGRAECSPLHRAGAALPQRLSKWGGGYKGGNLFASNPPPPSRPPKVFEPVFLQFEISRKSAGTKGAEFFFFGVLRGLFFFNPLCLCLKYSEFCGEFKNGCKHKKFDPRPELRVDGTLS